MWANILHNSSGKGRYEGCKMAQIWDKKYHFEEIKLAARAWKVHDQIAKHLYFTLAHG